MRRSRISIFVLPVAIVIACAASVASASAAELPMILFLPGESAPVEIAGTSTTANTEIQNAAGTLKGKGWTIDFALASGTSLGSATFLLAGLKKGETPCEGTAPAEWHIVLSPGKTLEVLLLQSEVGLECGATKIKLKGAFLGSLSPFGKEVLTTETFKSVFTCSATVGEPSLTKYINDEGAEVTAQFLANFGSGFKKACVNIAGEEALAPTKMVEIMG